MKFELVNKITRLGGRMFLKLKKHSPEILIGVGIIGVGAGVVFACKATLKAVDILDTAEGDIEDLKLKAEERGEVSLDTSEDTQKIVVVSGEYSKETKKEMVKIYARCAGNLVRTYSIGITCLLIGLTGFLAAHNIMRSRNLALAALAKSLEEGWSAYRRRVIDNYGAETDRRLFSGEPLDETDGVKPKKVMDPEDKPIAPAPENPSGYSMYARFFDESSRRWVKDPESNLLTLRVAQERANAKLKAQGHLFLNEVFDLLDIPRSKVGAICGWVYNNPDAVGDDFVDFGIYDYLNMSHRDFVNGYENCILLDFNVQGVIYDLI